MPRPIFVNTLFDGLQCIDPTPKCTHAGCNNPRMSAGYGRLLKLCSMHHRMKYEKDGYGYKKHRKDYCENIDGRLGFNCTTTIVDICQLDADHIDGNPSNNHPTNIQTLCKCCHAMKTKLYKDTLSPGRKTMKLSGRKEDMEIYDTPEQEKAYKEWIERERFEDLKRIKQLYGEGEVV